MTNDESLLYGRDAPGFVAQSRKNFKSNRTVVVRHFGEDIDRIQEVLDTHYRIVGRHAWTFNGFVRDSTPAEKIAFAAVHKGQLLLLSALELLRVGAFGSARPIFRLVYEGQVCAKYVVARNDEALAHRWLQGETVYFANAVLKKLEPKVRTHLSEFWKALNLFSHPTVYSGQLGTSAAAHLNDLAFDFAAMEILLAGQYHLIGSHVFSAQIRYYANRYDKPRSLPALRRTARELHVRGLKTLPRASRQLVLAYRSTWI